MSVLHVTQIARRIRESFASGIHKDDLNPKDPELDTKVQTRGLAAFAVHTLTECTINEACAAVTDGGEDNGIDAIFYSDSQNCLVLAQSKWIKDGNSEPDSAEVSKFCNGVRDLINSEFDRFNERVRKRQSIIENALSNYNCRLLLVLIHTGKSTLAHHATRQLTDLIDELNDGAPEIVQRVIDQRIAEAMQSLEKRSGKRHGILVHGNRLLACIVFHRKRFAQQLGSPSFKIHDHKASIYELVDSAVDSLTSEIGARHADNFLAVLFKNPTKSKVLFDTCVGSSTPQQMNLRLA